MPARRTRGLAARLQATARTGGGNALEGRIPGRLFEPALHRAQFGMAAARTSPCRRAHGASSPRGTVATHAPTSRGDRPREGRLRARRSPRRAKPMDAPAPRRAGRFGRVGRAGGDQTPHAARARDSESRAENGSTAPACVVGQGSAGEEASSAAERRARTVRGCGDGPLKGRESAWRVFRSVSPPNDCLGSSRPDGRRNAARVERNR
jgi:hypothetical protein